ncbi:MAG: 3-dehydroquinate synthase [Anaerolineaceae bacterium]|nr:3-dehydroquinate synthase [Anaerolineaceae bacterium]
MTDSTHPDGYVRRIFLYGPSGAGKTTVGEYLARQLNVPFDDLDVLIESESGRPITQIFEEDGEAGFREREASQLLKWLEGGQGVLALGGGALLHSPSREKVLRAGAVVCLTAPVPELAERLKHQFSHRPLLAGGDIKAQLEALLHTRAQHYASFPISIQTSGRSPEEIAREITRNIGWFHLPDSEEGYDVRIIENGLKVFPQILKELGIQGSIALVSDENVMPLYGIELASNLETAGFKTSSFTIPAGENNKTIATTSRLWEGFLSAGLDRGSLVLALGGGVVCDLTGFAAATFMRGVRWAAVPTSLLAMVDASLGGKTGVDLPFGKNLVGAFYPPALVLADPAVLGTLPVEEWRCGLAETVKHGLLADPDLFEECRQWGKYNPGFYTSSTGEAAALVRRSIAVKTHFVCQDPYEKGVRAALNLGHTIGHAVELVSDFAVRHGEAVAIGLVLEARLAERLGLAQVGLEDEITAILKKLGLPTALPAGLDQGALRAAIENDKKRKGGRVRFALPVCIGGYQLHVPSIDLVQEVLRG